MADTRQLSIETAEALLQAIKEAAPTAERHSTGALRGLAEAYAAVEAARPKKTGTANPRSL